MGSRHYRPTWAEISLDALQHNIQQFRQAVPKHVKIMAVIKADAYGHGAAPVAKEAVRCGADYLAVAFLDEALQLRRSGIRAPILILGYTPPEAFAAAVEQDIALTIYSEEALHALRHLPCSGRQAKVHIKIDTGMGRIGIADEREAAAYIEQALQIPHVKVEGLYTHYACADEKDKSYTLKQYERLERILNHFRQKGIRFVCNHSGNSAAAIDLPDYCFDMVRLGISMYGLYPSLEVNRKTIQLKPVMSLKTRIAWVKTLPPGSVVSYGAAYRTQSDEQIATLPIGYADGYSRMLSGKAQVLFRGKRVPVTGRICMDQTMINVTGMNDVAIGEEVVLFGQQAGAELPADELAQWLGTINYEIVCMVAKRVPRLYMRGGRCVEEVNYLNMIS